jgi:long-chain acyl-CoA synthetase
MSHPTPDILDKLLKHVAARPDEVFLQFLKEGRREAFTFRQVADQASSIAAFLKEDGIRAGDAVGLLMENHPAWGIAFLAIQWSGGLAVPLDTFHTPETLARLIEHAGCKLLISSESFLAQLQEIKRLWPGAPPVLLRSREPRPGYRHWESESRAWESGALTPPTARAADDPVTIIYTSGTTGDPKGVILTGRNIYGNIETALSMIEVGDDEHLLSILPLYHVLSLGINFLVPVFKGCRLTFLDSLDPARVIRTFSEEGITIFVCVPQFFYGIYRRIEAEIEKQSWSRRFLFRRLLGLCHVLREELGLNPGRTVFRRIHARFGSRFRLFGVGGARFDPMVEAYLRDLGFGLVQAYGMTETAALITISTLDKYQVGSVGRALPGTELRIDKPDAEGVGEILVRGPNVTKGYWRNPEATRQAMEDGWLRTGDSGRLCRSGFLYLTGRLKDVIVLSSGKNIYPEELEHHYQMRCPEIKEMCILGLADETPGSAGEKLHAVIVPDFDYLRSRKIVNTVEMIRWVLETNSQGLPSYKRVKSFEIRRDPLPRTTTRKIKRFQVEKERHEQAVLSEAEPAPQTPVAEPQDQVEAVVFQQILQMKRVPGLRKEMNLEIDLGFDSLERVEMLSNLQESLQVHVSDEVAAEILTVGELAEALRTAGKKEEAAARPRESAASWQEILRKPLTSDDAERMEKLLSPRPFAEFLLYLAALVTWLLGKVLFHFQVQDVEKLPREYPFLICPNHLSYLDPFFVVAAMPRRVIKRLFFLGYSEYFESGPLGFLGRMIKVIPVDADKQLRQALRLAAEGLNQSRLLCVFPEGERSIDGSLKTFRKGPAILASELKVPVVPVAILGTYEVWRRGDSQFHLHPVWVRFGDVIAPQAGETHEEFNNRLSEAVKALQAQMP